MKSFTFFKNFAKFKNYLSLFFKFKNDFCIGKTRNGCFQVCIFKYWLSFYFFRFYFLTQPFIFLFDIWKTETYSGFFQAIKMELFTKILNAFKPLTVFAKSSILYVSDWVLNTTLKENEKSLFKIISYGILYSRNHTSGYIIYFAVIY